MDAIIKPLISLGFVFFVLLALWSVNPTFDKAYSLFANSSSSVSELGLRFYLQR
jgi:hypothetical protein